MIRGNKLGVGGNDINHRRIGSPILAAQELLLDYALMFGLIGLKQMRVLIERAAGDTPDHISCGIFLLGVGAANNIARAHFDNIYLETGFGFEQRQQTIDNRCLVGGIDNHRPLSCLCPWRDGQGQSQSHPSDQKRPTTLTQQHVYPLLMQLIKQINDWTKP